MKMKDSGVEWIGEIPEGWELRKIKYILNERKEKNDPIETNFILSLSMERGVFPYSEKVGGGNKAKEDLTAYKIARPNDIVINSMNILAGSVGISKWVGAVSPVYYTYFSKDENIDIYYYHYLFQCSEFQKSLLGLGNGIMMKETESGKLNTIRMRIPSDKLGNLLFPIPTKLEQQKIADFLDSKIALIDQIIADTKRSIEELKAYKQSLITETVTKGLDPNVPMKDSGVEWIGEIPEGWKTAPLKFVFNEIGSGTTPSTAHEEFYEGKNFWIQSGDLYQKRFVSDTRKKLTDEGLKSSSALTVYSAPFIALAMYGASIGNVSISLVNASVNQAVAALSDTRIAEIGYIYYALTISKDFLVLEAKGGTQPNISQEILKKWHVPIPDILEQKKIIDYLNVKIKNIEDLISYKQKIINDYETYKKSLIYEYVTGKKQVN
ncbi:restriction endonuclease subunit S [Lactococcus muris]|uniref:Restriction endonuclease subunit S n=1 Tax=Lactococcus muris TaxID=2941330 RepID=A0ABV4DCD9_9LACT